MKNDFKEKARWMRAEGYSIKEIEQKLHVARSSVSMWVRGIQLNAEQLARIKHKGVSIGVLEKRRETRMRKTRQRKQRIASDAKKIISSLTKKDLMMLGVALYWGEGAKRKNGTIEIANSDPRIIHIMRMFFTEVMGIPDSKFKGRVQIHPNCDEKDALKYWSAVARIPARNFQKTHKIVSKASQEKKNNLPFGTFTLCVYDTVKEVTLKAWMERVYELAK